MFRDLGFVVWSQNSVCILAALRGDEARKKTRAQCDSQRKKREEEQRRKREREEKKRSKEHDNLSRAERDRREKRRSFDRDVAKKSADRRGLRRGSDGRILRDPKWYGKNDSRGKERGAIGKAVDRVLTDPAYAVSSYYKDAVDNVKDFLNTRI